jgi:hypothetical protein
MSFWFVVFIWDLYRASRFFLTWRTGSPVISFGGYSGVPTPEYICLGLHIDCTVVIWKGRIMARETLLWGALFCHSISGDLSSESVINVSHSEVSRIRD